MSNAVLDKAIWLVDEGRVEIVSDDTFYTEAIVEGIHGTYRVIEDPEGWHCKPVSEGAIQHYGRCSHIEAVGIARET